MRLFDITADYRKNNVNKPHYYVAADDEKSACKKFKEHISWLKIYGCKEVYSMEETEYILQNTHKFIIF